MSRSSATITIDQNVVPGARVAKRVMNFGQDVPGVRALAYEMRVALEQVELSLGDVHRQTYAELVEDAALGDEDALSRDLSVAGWPTLSDLATRAPELFGRYVQVHLASDLLDAFATGDPSSADFQLNDIAVIEVHGHSIVVHGTAFPTRP